jgi:starch-binding outer membrane protein, SusD/RagB family
MKKYKYYICVAVTLLASSCSDWLDLKPDSGLSLENYWKTKEQVQATTISCYESLMTGSSSKSRQVVEQLFLWGELRADMLQYGSNAPDDVYNVLNGFITEDLLVSNWAPVYKTINLCNTVIQEAPKVLDTDPSFTRSALNGYLSEAMGLRALMYFYLVRTFGEVPVKLDATIDDNVNLSIKKSPAGDVLNQIVSDLKHAEEMSVTSYSSTKDTKGRITQYAINAIQADVYLWREQYDSCLIACNKVVNSGQYGLIDNYASLFRDGLTNESIFELVFDQQLLNPFYAWFNTTNGRRLYGSTYVIDEFYMQDEENPDNYDWRGNYASMYFNNYCIWKYMGYTSTTARSSDQSYAPWIFYRYADILLMKAEALAQQNNLSESLDLVNRIRTRGHALDVSAGEGSSVGGMTDYILSERAREFAFEGKRWFDLLRTAKRNHYERKSILINLVTKMAPADRVTTMQNNIKDTLSHYLPIYKNELQTDTALVQNKFYLTN